MPKLWKWVWFQDLDHAAYLGSELSKAEIALRTGKEYVQDKEMFKK